MIRLPAPIASAHPAPWWCPDCGALEGGGDCTHRSGLHRPPTGPAPVPPGREWREARRRRGALEALARIGAAS